MKRKITILSFLMLCLGIASFAQTPVPNGDFENWTDSVTAQNWNSSNMDLYGLYTFNFVHQSTVVNGGSYAAKIDTKDVLGILTMSGIMTLGTYSFSTSTFSYTLTGGIPITGKPITLEGYLKYEPVAGDTMAIIVIMTKWNGTSRDTLFYNGIMANTSIPIYTVFDIPITYTPSTASPDTVNIIAISSAGYAPQVGSALYVDDFSFTYNPADVQESDGANFISVFPNPTSGFINVMLDGDMNTVKVYNIVGEEIFAQQTSSKNLNIDLTEFPAGVYMIEVSCNTTKYFRKIVISR
jgi:hypothetical protein